MFGDGEAEVVIPHKHLAEVVEEAVAIEAQEEFLKLEIEAGKSTFGVYPPDADTVTRYEAWRLAREADGHASP
jgi:regulator of RNase E activity RraA